MAESMFSSSWYRVAGLKPKLRSHAHISRHHYRGKLWYVLQDRSTGQNHRFSPEVHYVLALLDGQRSFQNIWDLALVHLGDDAPTQDEMLKLLGQLHSNDLLLCDVTPDALELFQRSQRKQHSKLKQRLMSPLSLRFPLWDPDAFLERWLFLVLPLFGWLGKVLWSLSIISAVFLAAANWPDLSEGIADRVMAPSNLLLLFFIYPLVKFLHELGHAFSTKVWGGEVHEMGVMLLVFMPIPYVDASSAWSFRERRKRVVVGAAGIIVELFLAALALFVWLNVEQGVVRAVCYNIMLISGVSTLFFNGNPLLRFDGYYIFSDLVEIPNLASRSNNYIAYLIQRYLFAINQINSPAANSGERVWFIVYGLASFVYRMLISFAIILFIAGKFFFIGVLLACWAIAMMLLMPLVKQIRFLFTSPVIQRHRLRAISISTAAIACILGFLFLLPMPLNSYSEGVVWLPEQVKVRAHGEGFIEQVTAQPNSTVAQGDILIVMQDPLLHSEQKVLQYRIGELKARYKKAWIEDQVQAQILAKQIEAVNIELQQVTHRIATLTLRSPARGVFILPRSRDIPGRFMHKGDLIAYVVDFPLTTVRAVVTQDNIGIVRERTESVQVRLANNIKTTYQVNVIRQIPAASEQLPSPALGSMGGGEIPVNPVDGEADMAFEPVFQLDLKLPGEANARSLGERVFVRFDLGKEALAWQWYRMARQLFLRQFSV